MFITNLKEIFVMVEILTKINNSDVIVDIRPFSLLYLSKILCFERDFLIYLERKKELEKGVEDSVWARVHFNFLIKFLKWDPPISNFYLRMSCLYLQNFVISAEGIVFNFGPL